MEDCPPLAGLEHALAIGNPDADLTRHLSRCAECRSKLETLRAHAGLAMELRAALPPSGSPGEEKLPRIEGYAVEDEVHRGGQGLVYRAVQRSTGRTVAVKLLADPIFASPRRLRRFEREVELAARLEHPNVVVVHESGSTADGVRYFVMRYVDGVPVTKVAWRSLAAAQACFVKICDAVAHAHQKGVLHRDLKPGNILVDASGEPFVLDFGLAAGADESCGEGATRLTMTGEFMGTLAYASPEHFLGDPGAIDVRSDVYALGVILYEMLTGELPYAVDGTPLQVMQAVTETPPGPPSARARHALGVRPDRAPAPVDEELDTIVLKALAKEPGRRYQSAGELARDVQHYLAGEPIEAKRDSTWYVLRKTLRRHRLQVGAALAVVLAIGVGGIASMAFWRRAVAAAHLADARADSVERLSDERRLRLATEAAEELWPAHPEQIVRMLAWLDEAHELIGRTELHRRTLEQLRLATGRSVEQEWQIESLTELVDGLDAFATPKTGLLADVEARLEFARGIGERSIDGVEARERWAEAIESIGDRERSRHYGGLRLEPQMGLLPIGPDPDSGLWEFAHLQTGEPAERDASGALDFTAESGLVFVLVPGGTFTMGAQRSDPDGPNYDERAMPDESVTDGVVVAPFFLSKYEMTQGQWERSAGGNPSSRGPSFSLDGKTYDLLHPVETVSWHECDAVTRHLGLELPSEAQWEYAARAGTTTPWWTGAEEESLEGAVNIADASPARVGAPWSNLWMELDDGYVFHAPVNLYRPNPFGLHNVYGNVWEWCSDEWSELPTEHNADVDRRAAGNVNRVNRGGGFESSSSYARSAFRNSGDPNMKGYFLGLRPARAIERTP